MIRTRDPRQMWLDLEAPVVAAVLAAQEVEHDDPQEPAHYRLDIDRTPGRVCYVEIILQPLPTGGWSHGTSTIFRGFGAKYPFVDRHATFREAKVAALRLARGCCRRVSDPAQRYGDHDRGAAVQALEWLKGVEGFAA